MSIGRSGTRAQRAEAGSVTLPRLSQILASCFPRTVGRCRPRIRARAGAVAAFAVALALPVTVFVQSSPEPSSGRGWSTVMGDLGNRYSTLDQINTQSVSRLGAAWMSERVTPPPTSPALTAFKEDTRDLTPPP